MIREKWSKVKVRGRTAADLARLDSEVAAELRSTPAGTPGLDIPTCTVEVPPELRDLPDEPYEPLDLDVFESWAETGEAGEEKKE